MKAKLVRGIQAIIPGKGSTMNTFTIDLMVDKRCEHVGIIHVHGNEKLRDDLLKAWNAWIEE